MKNSFKSIILVDDDEISNFLNQTMIMEYGFKKNVHVTSNGEEALTFMQENCNITGDELCPALIFLDLNMPVMDGFEFLEKYERSNGIPKCNAIYLLTSSANKKDIERSKQYKIAGYINKPLTAEKIKDIL